MTGVVISRSEPALGPAPSVLVVEDERRLRELLVEVIPEMGFPVRGVRTGEEALVEMRREAAGIVLLDVHLPGMSGLELLARLRAEGFTAQAIVLTAYADLEMARQAIREEISDLLAKPSPLGEIESALDRARRRHHARHPVAPVEKPAEIPGSELPVSLAEAERRQIMAALERHGGNRTAAAVELGISRRTLHYKLAEYRRGEPDEGEGDEG